MHLNQLPTTARYCPLVPQILSEIPRQCAGQVNMGFTAMSLYQSPKHYQSAWGIYTAGETHIRLTGALYPINSMGCTSVYDIMCGARGPFLAAAAAMVVVSFVSSRG
jgi:hypothetical protein